MRFVLLLAAALVFFQATAFAQSEAPRPRKIAVLEFDAVNEVEKKDGKGRMVSEFIATEAFRLGAYQLVERELIERLLTEMEFGKRGETFSSNAQKIGQMVEADAVLSGSISTLKDKARIEARLVNVADGRILAAEGFFAAVDLEALQGAAAKAARAITQAVTPKAADVVLGQKAFARPEAMTADDKEKLWIFRDAPVRLSQDADFSLGLERRKSGFAVDARSAKHRWTPKSGLDPNKAVPVVKISF